MKQEATGKTRRTDAERILKARVQAVDDGNPDPALASRTTFKDIAALVVADYTINEHKRSLGHLESYFDSELVVTITTDRIELYKAHRKEAGAKNATINRELAALKRAFRLGVKRGRLVKVPEIEMLVERNRRTGFFEREEYEAVLQHLPADVHPIVVMLYETGWRLDSEILTREWRHVDMKSGTVRLDAHETKNDEPRLFPFTPELKSMFEKQRDHTDAVERAFEMRIPWVFHRNGIQIKSFRGAWKKACLMAGLRRIPHDFRRTAVRKLERAGVPRTTAMALVGHETESIYRRYAIVDEKALRNGVRKLSAHRDDEEKRPAEVVPYKKRASNGGS
jgi:site-specific recombinase XerD